MINRSVGEKVFTYEQSCSPVNRNESIRARRTASWTLQSPLY